MEIKQEKKQEQKSPGQEQKDGQLQAANFAAGAERKGPSTSSGETKPPNGGSLGQLEAPKGPTREQYQSELRNSASESKKTNVPEAANKSKLKE